MIYNILTIEKKCDVNFQHRKKISFTLTSYLIINLASKNLVYQYLKGQFIILS